MGTEMNLILFDINNFNDTKQLKYFNRCLDAINEYFVDTCFIVFKSNFEQMHSPTTAFQRRELRKKIKQKTKSKFITADSLAVMDQQVDLALFDFTQQFQEQINYLSNSYPTDRVIIPLAYCKENRELKCRYLHNIYFIGNYDEEINSNIAEWSDNDDVLEISAPTSDDLFPARGLCKSFGRWRDEILKSFIVGEKNSSFQCIGREVALRNRYVYDATLSKLNHIRSGAKRCIFRSADRQAYLSIDFENGGFEVFDRHARHLGQYKFSGEYEKSASPSNHILYLK